VKLYEAIDTQRQVYLVMEYVEGESLHAYLKRQPGRKLHEDEAKRIIKQLLQVLAYLHSKNVTHRDIKLENIIINHSKGGALKLIDFGFCCCTAPGATLKIFCGTPSYMSPEITRKKDYLGPPTDVWASGILLYALLCGSFPFKGFSDKDLYARIQRGLFSPPDYMSREAKSFIGKMLVVDVAARATASDLLGDPWLKGVADPILS